MGSDLAALTPPLLVCAAFLVAVGAFIKHEMRHGDASRPERGGVSEGDRNPLAADQNHGEPSATSPGPRCRLKLIT